MINGSLHTSDVVMELLAEGESLTIERHSPEDLHDVLVSVGHTAIVAAIESAYLKTVSHNPGATIGRQSVSAIRIGNTKQTALSQYGRLNRSNNYRSPIEAKPEHRDYWKVIETMGFSAHIWRVGSLKGDAYSLMLRNPETDPELITPLEHLPQALGFLAPAAQRELKPKLANALQRHDTSSYISLWNHLEDANEQAVDRQAESFDREAGEIAKVGKIISSANLKTELRGNGYLLADDGYLEDLRDAEEVAFLLGLDDVSLLIREEIHRVTTLKS